MIIAHSAFHEFAFLEPETIMDQTKFTTLSCNIDCFVQFLYYYYSIPPKHITSDDKSSEYFFLNAQNSGYFIRRVYSTNGKDKEYFQKKIPQNLSHFKYSIGPVKLPLFYRYKRAFFIHRN